jgi:diguanylate cyclase (GGDEF)-like protein
MTDISTNETRLAFQATHDELTGLPNRKILRDRLLKAIATAKRTQTKLAVLFLDLDNFKNVNDSLGHQFGDALLKEVAQRLIPCCRTEDTVSRFGGDEFVILLPAIQANEPAAVRVALRILGSFQMPLKIKSWRLDIKASIGISVYPSDGDNPDLLLKNADLAMYEAKLKGKNNYALFTKEMDTIVQRRIMLESNIREALDRREFRVYYQPKINIRTGAIEGMEALVRWHRKDGEIIPPDEFIFIAEEIGLIVELGEWVLSTACRQTMLWHQQGFPHLGIAVNLSGKQFQGNQLLSQVKGNLEKFSLPTDCLTLEITENIVMENVEAAITMMAQFRALGIRLSIDDFGTGYSSLAYLRRFPINELKIDKTFIIDTPQDEEASNIVRSIVSLAHHLQLKVVAEGVETLSHVEFLKSLGISTVQGYFYSKPLPVAAFEKMLTRIDARQKT